MILAGRRKQFQRLPFASLCYDSSNLTGQETHVEDLQTTSYVHSKYPCRDHWNDQWVGLWTQWSTVSQIWARTPLIASLPYLIEGSYHFRTPAIKVTLESMFTSPQNVWVFSLFQCIVTQVSNCRSLWGGQGESLLYILSMMPWDPFSWWLGFSFGQRIPDPGIGSSLGTEQRIMSTSWSCCPQSSKHPSLISFNCIDWAIPLLAAHLSCPHKCHTLLIISIALCESGPLAATLTLLLVTIIAPTCFWWKGEA